MIAIPAVDLREGSCVQLVGGAYSQEKVRLDDPIDVARSWQDAGFGRLHVVDLDAATGRGNNRNVVRSLLSGQSMTVQVGGGIREVDDIGDLLQDGAHWVVAGTRALEDEDWLDEAAGLYPGRLIVAADVRERKVVTRGWARTLTRNVLDVVEELNAHPLAGLLVTAVHMEGRMQGTDLHLMEDVVEAARFPVIASGGVSSMDDLHALQHRGASGAVIGMALYTGALDARAVASEFSE